MVCCAVQNCNSNNSKNLKRNKSLSVQEKIKFFRFPQNKVLAQKWIEKCGRKTPINIKYARICAKHFNREDYVRNIQHDLLKYSPKNFKKLNSDAVPTVNLPDIVATSIDVTKPLVPTASAECQEEFNELIDDIELIEPPKCIESNEEAIDTIEQFAPAELIVGIYTEYVEKTTNTDSTVFERELYELRAQTVLLQKRCEELKEQKERIAMSKQLLEQKYIMALTKNRQNRKKYLKERKKCQQLERENECINKIFTPTQRYKLRIGGKRVKWTADEIAKSIAIYSNGPKAYRFLLKQNYPLPAVVTLKKWATKIEIDPGFLTVVFKLLEKCSLSPLERVCILMADEMKILKSYEYDKKSDILHGPSNYVQVLMLRGLFEDWRQPIYYNYDTQLSADLIYTSIRMLHQINFRVVAVVSDLGGGNRGLWNELGINESQPFFHNPADTTKKVYVFNDVPHLIKLLRNHLLDSGLLVDKKLLTIAPLVELYNKQKNNDLKIACRLSAMHLNCKFANRQKVKYATQLFSHTNSQALLRLGSLGYAESENWNELAMLLKHFNDWFDVFNSKVPRIDTRQRMAAYGLSMEEHNRILNDVAAITKDMRVGKKKSMLPFQKGILSNISALKMLYADLNLEYGTTFLLTYRLNQDPLEMFFGIMRAKGGLNDHPTPLHFKYRLRSYLLGRNQCIVSEHANVENDKTISETTLTVDKKSNMETSVITDMLQELAAQTEEESEEIEAEPNMSDLEHDGLEHVAGYILHRLKKKHLLIFEKYVDKQSNTFTWTNQLSEGGLIKPNAIFLNLLLQLEIIFNEYNSKSLKIGFNYLQNQMKLAANISVEEEVKKIFFRCKLYFKIRILNSAISEAANTKKRKLNKTIN